MRLFTQGAYVIMKDFERLTPKQKKRLYEFIDETLLLSEEEKAAIDAQIPMTQELFEQCIEHCAAIDAQLTLNDLMTQYPEFLAEYIKKEENAIGAKVSEDGEGKAGQGE